MLKYLLIAVAAFVLYKLFVNERGRKAPDKAEKKERERRIAAGELVKDPCCGTYVDADSSITVRDGKTLHHFCSYECRKKFLEELAQAGREIPELNE
jgi:YHS domain-containing protein